MTISYLLVQVLTGIFDPPPSGAALPFGYLLGLFASVSAATGLAVQVLGWPATRTSISRLREL